MTRKAAIERAVAVLSVNPDEAVTVEVLNSILEQYEKTRKPMSDEQKATLNAARKAKTAAARAVVLDATCPIVREIAVTPMTANEIFVAGKGKWMEGFTVAKLQNVLINEMAPELDKVEVKGKPNTYQIKTA